MHVLFNQQQTAKKNLSCDFLCQSFHSIVVKGVPITRLTFCQVHNGPVPSHHPK